MPKSFKNLWKAKDVGLFGPSWRTSWRPRGSSWVVLEASRATLEVSWTLWGRLGGRLAVS
eukprot:1598084-Pyramimonas_sp.AAC.1